MKFPSLQSFNLEGMTIRALASPPAAQPLKQSVPGLSQPGSCSLSSTQMNGTKAADSASASKNSLAGYGKPLPPLGLGSSHTRSKSQQYQYCPRAYHAPPQPVRSILSTSQSKRARRSITSRGILFADASRSNKPLTETREISRWLNRDDFVRLVAMRDQATKETDQELAHFPPNFSRECWKHWCNSPIATTIARGEHRGRLGYILKYYECNKYVKMILISQDTNFCQSQPVVVKRSHLQRSAPGSLTSSHQPSDQHAGGDADDFSMSNWMAEDDDYQWEDEDEDEEEITPTFSPSTTPTTTTTIGKKHPCPSSLQGRPAKRQKMEEPNNTTTTITTTTTTIGKKHPCPSSLKGRPAKRQKVEQSTTIAGGKYAGQKCIILKHLARRVRVQLLDSGLVTCISRSSLGLDEEKTIWHVEPRRSPRIKAMKMMEASTHRGPQSLVDGNP